MFDKKTVLEVREDIPKKSTFLRDEFFNDERKYWTDTIIIESKKNGIPILPIVTENSQGTLMTSGVVKRDTLKISLKLITLVIPYSFILIPIISKILFKS